MKLSNIASINYGVTFRRKVNTKNIDNGIKIIQMGNIDDTTTSLILPLNLVANRDVNAGGFTDVGDILIKTRGNKFTNILIDSKSNNILFASPLARIRIHNNSVTPEYVSWYLNSPEARRYFNIHSRGTTINTLNLNILNNIDIPIPSLKKQKIIGNIHKLSSLEVELQRSIIELKKEYYQSLLQAWSRG